MEAEAAVKPMNIVILGLSITSSWGNGHATTYRSLIKGLAQIGHNVLFLERDVPWYASNRDTPDFPFCKTKLYGSMEELKTRYDKVVREADLVMVGSYVPQGIDVGRWVTRVSAGVTAFYDIDTPVTLASLAQGRCEYLHQELIPRYDMYLSFTGGQILKMLERQYGSPMARPLYCSVDPDLYRPLHCPQTTDLGYIGTYSADRQGPLGRLLLEPAWTWQEGSFVVAGPLYPADIAWPANVRKIEHLPPSAHPEFYSSLRFTLNLTRADMIAAGYSPSVRLFEAASCGTPIISDNWPGLDTFFKPGKEILIAEDAQQVLSIIRTTSDQQRFDIADAARIRIMKNHTSYARAEQLDVFVKTVLNHKARRRHRAYINNPI